MLYDEWRCQVLCYTKKAKLEAQSLSFSTPNSEKETNGCPAAPPSTVTVVFLLLLVFWCFSISVVGCFSLFWHKLGCGLTLALVHVRASHFGISLRSPSCSKPCCTSRQVGGIPSAFLQPGCQQQGRAVCWSPRLCLAAFGPTWGYCCSRQSCFLALLRGRGCPRGCFWPLGHTPEMGGPRASRWQHGTADGSAHCSQI